MSEDESFISSDDDDCYVNFAAKYKKVVREKIQYKQEEEEKISDVFSLHSYYTSPKKEDSVIDLINGQIGEKETRFNNPPRKKRCTDNSTASSDTDSVSTASIRSSRLRSDNTSSSLCENVIDSIALDDSIDANDSSHQELNTSDYIVIGSPEKKRTEDENYSIDVKIIWKSKNVVKLEHNRYEPMQTIFQHFAKMENVSEDLILITKNDKPVRTTDTPVSLGLTILDILEGGIVNTCTRNSDLQGGDDEEDDCKLKIQSANSKQATTIVLKKDQNFNSVIFELARKHEVSPDNIKLYFDGDQIEAEDTPESLDLDQEACIDLKIVCN